MGATYRKLLGILVERKEVDSANMIIKLLGAKGDCMHGRLVGPYKTGMYIIYNHTIADTCQIKSRSPEEDGDISR